MKKIRIESYIKGIFLLAAGIIVVFLPGLLSGLFYFSGAALIIYSIITMAVGISKGMYSTSIPKSIIEIIIGFLIIIFPKFLSIGVPIIIGIFFLLSGVNSFFNAIEMRKISSKLWISSAFSAVLMIICGLFFITNPASISKTFVKIAGIIFMIIGIAIIAREYLRSKKPPSDSVIDIDSYSVKDNKK